MYLLYIFTCECKDKNSHMKIINLQPNKKYPLQLFYIVNVLADNFVVINGISIK